METATEEGQPQPKNAGWQDQLLLRTTREGLLRRVRGVLAVMLTRLPSLSSLPSPRITRYQTWTFAEQTKLAQMVNQSPAFQWAWRTAGPGSNRLASPNLLFISLCPRGTDRAWAEEKREQPRCCACL